MSNAASHTLSAALEAALADYADANPKSSTFSVAASEATPGGISRNVLYMSPFPLVMASGQGAYLTSLDGQPYLDFCGEYSACLFGHSHPTITGAMIDAIQDGIALGSANRYEGRLAALLCARYPSLERVRFTNSGTEASSTCLALIRGYRKKSTFIVMEGGYHGGFTKFGTAASTAAAEQSFLSMNLPHKFALVPYNDVGALEATVAQHADDLAAILLEPMQGSSGCIPAEQAFLQACRDQATATGAVLVFDEVMTSRMALGGYQSVVGITPDMTLLGKYLAGGGCNFGAFGGRADIMDMLLPPSTDTKKSSGGGLYHSGTYSNNVVTMAAAVATLEHVWTEQVAKSLWDEGVWLRETLNTLSAEHHASMHVSGTGSLLAVHFTDGGRPVRSTADVEAGNGLLKELFFMDMLRKNIYLARRCQLSLMSVHTRDELEKLVQAVREFLVERKEFVSL